MTIEFDTDPTKTNLHPDAGIPGKYLIQQSAGNIKVTVKDAVSSSMKLLTEAGDFLDEDSTSVKDGQLIVSFHKSDSITGNVLERIELLGDLLLEVKKVIHRREEKFTFLVNVRR